MWKAPDPEWIPYLKVSFGFVLLGVLGWLAHAIAIGRVEATSSYGLGEITGCLQTLAGAWAGWGFGQAVIMAGKKTDPPKDGE